ncbi:MAG: hypothetical protein AB8B87_16680 [Granulosicoccus sp.]
MPDRSPLIQKMDVFNCRLLLLPLIIGIAGCSETTDNSPNIVRSADSVELAVIGDVPYEPDDYVDIGEFPQLVNSINNDPFAMMTVHVGDIKGGETPCVDQKFQDVFNVFQTFDEPLVYSIGDNEWTDCDRVSAGSYEPEERLGKLREIFFATPGQSLGGNPRSVDAQDNYPENQVWEDKGIVFGTLHVVGTNNNLITGSGRPGAAEQSATGTSEYARRTAANITWLRGIFERATQNQSAGIALFFHADMSKELVAFDEKVLGGFSEFVQELSIQAEAFSKPVVIVSGDNRYRVDVGVEWFSLYDVNPVSNITQIIVPRGVEYQSNSSRVKTSWLRLEADADLEASRVFEWELVTRTYAVAAPQ